MSMNNPLTEGKRIKLGYDYFATGFSGVQLSEAYYRLIADKQQERILFETATLDQVDEVYNPGDACCDENDRMTTEEMVLEAIRVQRFARTDSKMAALVRVFNGYLKDKNIEAQAPIIGTPKKLGLFATVTVQIPFSDGQVVSIIFHSPDNNKMKITADDEIIAFRWLLNKRDITHVVSPENDAEVSLQEIGKRTAQLVEKNSARFQVMQKDLVEQKKKLDELKTQMDEALKHHDKLMAFLKDGQDAVETMDVKIANLKGQIEKQKAFNDGLKDKIDALKAQQAGNDGKAASGDTPKTEAEMKAEQEKETYENAKAAFVSEISGLGFEKDQEEDAYRIDVIDTAKRNGKSMRSSIKTNFLVNDGKVVVNAAGKQKFSALIKNAAGAFNKAVKALADEKAKFKTVAEWMAQYGGIASKFNAGDRFSVLKFIDRPEDGYYLQPAVVSGNTDSVSNSHLPGVDFNIENHTRFEFDYEELTSALANGAVKPWNEEKQEAELKKTEVPSNGPQAIKIAAPEPTEPAAVGVLNDILSGKYDGDSTKLGEVLDQAASDLEKDGKAEEYDALLNQAADYLTEILKKEAA